MRHLPTLALLATGILSACAPTYQVGAPAAVVLRPAVVPGVPRTEADFSRVAARIEPVAEGFCRESAGDVPPNYCDFSLVLDADPKMPPNAYQTRTEAGRPVVVVSRSLLAQMLSDDEVAFVLSHETAHQIANHLSKQQQSQVMGALILGGLASASAGASGVSDERLRQVMDLGAFVGSRAYSQSYELEADWVGAFIAERASYDPERGAEVFGRGALAGSGGPVLLSSHPGSPERQATVAAAAEEIRRQRAAGLVPRPKEGDRVF